MLQTASRLGTALCVAAIIVLSWLPKELERRTGAPGQIEHAFAYAGTALLTAFATRRHRAALLGLAALAIVMEVGQIWVPGRTAQVVDAAASMAGAGAGLLLGRYLRRRWRV